MLTTVQPLLRPAEEPDGEIIPSRDRLAEVVTSPDALGTPCETIAWHKLAEPRRKNPHRWVEWLVKIRFNGDEGWYEFSGVLLRPADDR
jgi:hypothetical protein